MATRKTVRVVAMAAGALLAAASLPATAAFAGGSSSAAAASHSAIAVPAAVRTGSAVKTGTLPGNQLLRVTLGLATPHPAAEEQFLNALQTKGTPQFHHYLTQAQFTARYDPSAASEASVVAWAKANGLTVVQRFPDRLLVDVTGTAATLSKAFKVTLNTYRYNGDIDFSNAQPPTIPASLKGVVNNVEGLDNIQRLMPDQVGPKMAKQKAEPFYSSGPALASAGGAHGNAPAKKSRAARKAVRPNLTNGAIDPNDLNSSQGYDFGALYRQGHCCNPDGNSGSSPVQSSIDLMGFGTLSSSDVGTFAGKFGLAYNYNSYNIDGTPPTNNADDNAEDTLDMEYATATSNSYGSYQDTAHVTEYFVANFNASTFTDAFNFMYTDNDARTASASYGGEEGTAISGADMDTNHNVLNNMVGTGWTLLASSGDHGSYGDCANLGVQYPASDSDMIAVGGTRLTLDSNGNYSSEVAWSPDGACGSNGAGSGGGCSSYFAAPSWQGPLYPCGSGSRADPDISLNSDGATAQYVYFNGGDAYFGGTSIASPEMAGFSAQNDAYLLSVGDPSAGNFASQMWYEGQNNSAPHNPFYDITSGCNYSAGQAGYCATTGYDLVTGWGSANMLQLAWMEEWFLNGDDGRPNVSFSGPPVGAWYNTNQIVSWTVADSGGGSTPTGVAGFSQYWDATAYDPNSEAHQGSGNSFYDGPQFPNATSGYLFLADAGLGCHAAYVTAWDNMGYSNGAQGYGYLCYDTTTPTGSVSINGGAGRSNSSSVTLSLSASNPGETDDPITEMRLSDGSGYGAWQSYNPSVGFVLAAGDGTRRVYVEYQNAAGTISSAASDSIVVDTTSPVITTAPTITLAATALSPSPHLNVTWAGSDSGTGIQHYTLQKSVDGGSYQNVALPTRTATAVTVAAPPGHSYQFRVEAVDFVGNTSAFKVGTKRTLSLVQENNSSVHYSSGWARALQSGSSANYVETTTTHGATATLNFTGASVALVTTVGPAYGLVSLAVDGGTARSVTDHAASTAEQQIKYVHAQAAGAHTLVITDAGGGSTKQLDVDAFLILA